MISRQLQTAERATLTRLRKRLLALGIAVSCFGVAALADDRGFDVPERAGVGVDVSFGFTPAPQDVIVEDQQDLAVGGHWIDHRSYGRCWVPDNRPDNWRPYTVGHWVSTDDGWCWTSEGDEATWGDTCYHYGRWYDDADSGWVWVPGTVWAPSWVSWREGGDYSAWAPLPPECGDGISVTPDVADAYIRPDDYVVVDQRFMADPGMTQHVQVNNVTIINQTTNITRISYADNRAVNQGVAVAHVQQRVGRPIQPVRMQRATSAADARRLASQGTPVMYSPPAVETHLKAHPIVARPAPAPKVIAEHRATIPRRAAGQPAPRAHETAVKPLVRDPAQRTPQAQERPAARPATVQPQERRPGTPEPAKTGEPREREPAARPEPRAKTPEPQESKPEREPKAKTPERQESKPERPEPKAKAAEREESKPESKTREEPAPRRTEEKSKPQNEPGKKEDKREEK